MFEDFIYDVAARNYSNDAVVELRLCGHCIALGQVTVLDSKPNFQGPCMWCGRGGADVREILKPRCDCQPSVYRVETGYRKDRSGTQVPCFLLACAHEPCTAHMIIDYDWPLRGVPTFRHIHEGN